MQTHVEIDQRARPIVYADQRKRHIIVMFAGRNSVFDVEGFRLKNSNQEAMPIAPSLRNNIALIDFKHLKAGVYFLELYEGDSRPIRLVTF